MLHKPKSTRAVNPRREIQTEQVHRDTRPLGQKIADELRKPDTAFGIMLAAAGIGIIWPATGQVMVVLGGLYTLWLRGVRHRLPFKIPAFAKALDWGDPTPGLKPKPRKARSIAYFGIERESNEELWLDNDTLRRHILILGTTGSGKTEALLSIVTNALTWSSGFLYVDGKGDTSLWGKVKSLAKRFGRDDDVLILNFMKGGSERYGESNTINFFESASSAVLTETLVSLMPGGGGGGNDDMWRGRAIGLLTAINIALVDLREKGHILLNVDVARKFLTLDNVMKLAQEKPIESGVPGTPSYLDLRGYKLSSKAKEALTNYLEGLPGFSKPKMAKGEPQSDQCLQQHGFCSMQFTRVLGSLADVYDYIFMTPMGEIDLDDVVINRRILVCLLPALEKSSDEIKNLGKIVVATLRAMMGRSLGASLEGEWADVLDNRPTNSASPFISVFDEVGYYCVEGMASMAAQARSIGFCLIFAGQDVAAMKKAGGVVEKEVDAIIANCNLKMFGKLEDPGPTLDLFLKTVGEGIVSETSGYTMQTNGVSNGYMDMNNASLQKRARGDFQDLKDQTEGQFHYVYESIIVRGASFFADPPAIKTLRRNRFVKVRFPEAHDENTVRKTVETVRSILTRRNFDPLQRAREFYDGDIERKDEAAVFARGVAGARRGLRSDIEAACAGFIGMARYHAGEGPEGLKDTIDASQKRFKVLTQEEIQAEAEEAHASSSRLARPSRPAIAAQSGTLQPADMTGAATTGRRVRDTASTPRESAMEHLRRSSTGGAPVRPGSAAARPTGGEEGKADAGAPRLRRPSAAESVGRRASSASPAAAAGLAAVGGKRDQRRANSAKMREAISRSVAKVVDDAMLRGQAVGTPALEAMSSSWAIPASLPEDSRALSSRGAAEQASETQGQVIDVSREDLAQIWEGVGEIDDIEDNLTVMETMTGVDETTARDNARATMAAVTRGAVHPPRPTPRIENQAAVRDRAASMLKNLMSGNKDKTDDDRAAG